MNGFMVFLYTTTLQQHNTLSYIKINIMAVKVLTSTIIIGWEKMHCCDRFSSSFAQLLLITVNV